MLPRSTVAALWLAPLLASSALAAADDWPTFRGDASRSGAPFDLASGGTGAVKWKLALVNESASSPAVARGRVFVASDDGNLTAAWASNGTKNWTYEVGVRVTSSPVVVDSPIPSDLRQTFRWAKSGVGDLVLVGDDSGILHAVKAHDGELWWRHATQGQIKGAPAVAGGLAYVAATDGVVHAVTLDVGAVRWTRATDGPIHGSPLVAGGRVHAGTQEGTLYALDAATGAVAWTFDAGARIDGSPSYGAGLIVFGARDGRVRAVDADDGTERWSYALGADPTAHALFGAPAIRDGAVYVASVDGHLYALDLDDGELRWKVRARPTSSPAAAGGAVFVGAEGGVAALHPESGAQLWKAAMNARFDSSAAVVNGTLYVASARLGLKQGADDHHLYALNAGDAVPLDGSVALPPPPPSPDAPPTAPPSSGGGDFGKGEEEGGLPLPMAVPLAALAAAAALRRRR